MNELALRYSAAYQIAEQSSIRLRDAESQYARDLKNLTEIGKELQNLTPDEVLYFEGYDDTVIVVSKTILEVCPLHKETT